MSNTLEQGSSTGSETKQKKLCKYKISKVICYTLAFVHKALAHRNTTCVGHVLFCFWWGTERENQRSRRFRSQQRCLEELCILWVHMSVCLSVWVPTESVCYCRGSVIWCKLFHILKSCSSKEIFSETDRCGIYAKKWHCKGINCLSGQIKHDRNS